MAVKQLNPADVSFIAVHCSATQDSMDVGVKEIDRWHRDKGFLKIGYHFVIRRSGVVEVGRPVTEVGAHVEDFNSRSIGICMVGGVNKQLKAENNFTPAQFASLANLLKELAPQFPQAVVQGHRDFPNVAKACPSFDVRAWLKTVQV